MSQDQALLVRELGVCDYQTTWDAMRRFTDERSAETPDEIWILEHLPVFTQGQAGKAEHILNPGQIPVVQADRGGQVTYHGPGQLVAYLLVDLERRHWGVRDLVDAIEQALIACLAAYGVEAEARRDAPGVYVDGAKIASLGLRVRRGCSYHGLALNVDIDLEPFSRINPCGLVGQSMTRLRDLGVTQEMLQVSTDLCAELAARLGYNAHILVAGNS